MLTNFWQYIKRFKFIDRSMFHSKQKKKKEKKKLINKLY